VSYLLEIRPLFVVAVAGLLAGCSPEAPAPEPMPSNGNNGGGSGGMMAAAGSGGNLAVAGSTATAGAGGTAGIGGTAGTGGDTSGAGTAGTAGSAGSAGAAGAAGVNLKQGMSAGCGMQVLEPPGEYVEHQITPPGVDAAMYPDDVNRRYFTKLPDGYTESTPWPLVFYGPGCGGNGNAEGTPVDGAVDGKAILVFLSYTSSCFKTGGMNSPEVPYFEAVLNEIEANYCIDKSKIFVSGYSSGGWLSNLLSCSHGDRIRAIGTAAGGLGSNHPECKGSLAAIMHASTNDDANPIVNIDEETGIDEGSGAARDRLLMVNGCDMTSTPWIPAGETEPPWDFCSLYTGCDNGNDVVWCEEENVGHSNGGQVSSQGWWQFWSGLP